MKILLTGHAGYVGTVATGVLTEAMFHTVFKAARGYVDKLA